MAHELEENTNGKGGWPKPSLPNTWHTRHKGGPSSTTSHILRPAHRSKVEVAGGLLWPLWHRGLTLFAAVLVGFVLAPLPQAAAQQPDDVTQAPLTTLSADGRTSTDGTRTLTVSRADAIDPAGEVVTVTGSGYNEEKGIYVAFCVLPESRETAPTPCGGGIDLTGETGASRWISSNPPSYGQGLAEPYDPNGSFEITLAIGPRINDDLDCREVRCGVVTRSDHARTSDRSQDIIVPVSFLQPGETPPAPGPEMPTEPSPGAALEPTPLPDLPDTALSDDGRTVTRGERSVGVSEVAGLSPEGELVTVTGQGFDEADGVYVGLCVVPSEAEPPALCSTGADVSAWVSSSPPAYARDLAQPYDAGGAFTVDLTLRPVLDAATDCRSVACGIVVRPDDVSSQHPLDYVLLPVSFSIATDGDGAPSASSSAADDSGSGLGTGVLLLAAGALAFAGGGAFMLYRRRAIQRSSL